MTAFAVSRSFCGKVTEKWGGGQIFCGGFFFCGGGGGLAENHLQIRQMVGEGLAAKKKTVLVGRVGMAHKYRDF